jgi:hypothetical protein
MGWLLADIATTLIVALAYWTLAVLRDAVRSLASAGRRVRSGGAVQVRGMLPTPGIAAARFAAAEPQCLPPAAPRG